MITATEKKFNKEQMVSYKRLAGLILDHTSVFKGSTGKMRINLDSHICESHIYNTFDEFNRLCFELEKGKSGFVGISESGLDFVIRETLWNDEFNRAKIVSWLESNSDRCAVVSEFNRVIGYWRKPVIVREAKGSHTVSHVQDNIKPCSCVKIALSKVYDGDKEIVVISTLFPIPREFNKRSA